MNLFKITILVLGLFGAASCITDDSDMGSSYGYPTTYVPDYSYGTIGGPDASWAMAQEMAAAAWLSNNSYAPQFGYVEQMGYAGGSEFYSNSNLGTAVSSSGESGYIALGDGGFVSW